MRNALSSRHWAGREIHREANQARGYRHDIPTGKAGARRRLSTRRHRRRHMGGRTRGAGVCARRGHERTGREGRGMSITTLVLGQSGTGKTASLRNLNPEQVALIKATEKPLPFRAAGWAQVTTDNWQRLIQAAHKAAHNGREIIVVDDFQYIMANEFMRRSEEKGFEKFTEIARHAWEIINALTALPAHVRVYILSHTQDDDYGRTKIKTIGKMLDEKITLEGLFTTV